MEVSSFYLYLHGSYFFFGTGAMSIRPVSTNFSTREQLTFNPTNKALLVAGYRDLARVTPIRPKFKFSI